MTYICVYTYTFIPLLQTVEYHPDIISRHVRCLLLLLHHGPPSPPFAHNIQMHWASFMRVFVYMLVSFAIRSQVCCSYSVMCLLLHLVCTKYRYIGPLIRVSLRICCLSFDTLSQGLLLLRLHVPFSPPFMYEI